MLTNRDATKLEELRSRLAENSESLIRLFRERASLAREIGELKKDMGLPPRIRERENTVIESMPELDTISKSIMSALFEFSIVNEMEHSEKVIQGSSRAERIGVSGSWDELNFLAGLMVSRPGVEVYAEKSLPPAIERGLQTNGAHIIHDKCDAPDITICLQKDGEDCDISLSGQGSMYIKPHLNLATTGTVVWVRK